MRSKRLVLDANILIRAIWGRRVRQRIETYTEKAFFFERMAAKERWYFRITG